MSTTRGVDQSPQLTTLMGDIRLLAAVPKADGVDAPRRHLCAKVEVLKHH